MIRFFGYGRKRGCSRLVLITLSMNDAMPSDLHVYIDVYLGSVLCSNGRASKRLPHASASSVNILLLLSDASTQRRISKNVLRTSRTDLINNHRGEAARGGNRSVTPPLSFFRKQYISRVQRSLPFQTSSQRRLLNHVGKVSRRYAVSAIHA
jgi:hypothetical protein